MPKSGRIPDSLNFLISANNQAQKPNKEIPGARGK
jgi:hypothetical protein